MDLVLKLELVLKLVLKLVKMDLDLALKWIIPLRLFHILQMEIHSAIVKGHQSTSENIKT